MKRLLSAGCLVDAKYSIGNPGGCKVSYSLDDVIHETRNHWVLRVKNGFEVYKTGVTHSVRCAIIGYKGEEGKKRAITECERWESNK